ncbi:hypothetical protein P7F88_25550 [Vibrio hannami]|uniref:hypothetical protein n=1 Tax=Vibrio hannami TaxID=2717094 RepID=UPI00240F7615|nr:hypothetical protein [Vibrio hannami]MDG3089232.1 hypothetical protein [Vibrio hannami]
MVLGSIKHNRRLAAVLPEDLQKRVEDGYITEDDARELTRARAQAQTKQAQAEAARKHAEQQQTAQSQQATQQAIATAVQQREAALRAEDPDFAQKSPLVQQQVKAMLEMGATVTTPEQGVALIDRAYELVKANSVRPARPATMPTPSSTSRSQPATPAPKSALDAMTANPLAG